LHAFRCPPRHSMMPIGLACSSGLAHCFCSRAHSAHKLLLFLRRFYVTTCAAAPPAAAKMRTQTLCDVLNITDVGDAMLLHCEEVDGPALVLTPSRENRGSAIAIDCSRLGPARRCLGAASGKRICVIRWLFRPVFDAPRHVRLQDHSPIRMHLKREEYVPTAFEGVYIRLVPIPYVKIPLTIHIGRISDRKPQNVRALSAKSCLVARWVPHRGVLSQHAGAADKK
jgi:hypothetical protein